MKLPYVIIGVTSLVGGIVFGDWLAYRSAKANNLNKAGGIFQHAATQLD